MDLIERSLHAVKGHLPAAQQDAAAELEDDLRSRVADREQELGRPLTEDEVAAMLRSLGRPMVFAARYHGHQPLIGAAMMPYYLLTLKVGAGIALLVNVVVAVVLLALGTPVGESLKGVFVFPFTTLPIQIGWITVVFAVIDRYVTVGPLNDSWDPRSLPPVRTDRRRPSRVGIVGDMVGVGIALAWWMAAFNFPFLVVGPMAAFLEPGPGWTRAYVPVAALMVSALGGHAVALIRPDWRMPARLAGHLLALTGITVLWLSGDLIAPTTEVPPAELARVVEIVQWCARGSLGLAAAITLFELGRDLWKLRRNRLAAALVAMLVLALAGCVPPPHPSGPGIARLSPSRSDHAFRLWRGSLIEATSAASMTSAVASTSSPDV
jgi:hypothetical protein